MDKCDASKPIATILTGSNYNQWVEEMKSFLISCKLWHVVTGEVTKPTKSRRETNAKFAKRLGDWERKNHKIIAWFRSTSIPSIHAQFARYDSAKEIWDFLANQHRTTGLAHCYQLWTTLVNLKQESDQSVKDFLAQVEPIWNQISQARISEEHLRLILLLMALRPEFEAVRTSLLHHHPQPSLDTAIQEIVSEETRLNLVKAPEIETVLATARSTKQKPKTQPCKNCDQVGHSISTCPTVECGHCHGFGHILDHCPNLPPRLKHRSSKSKSVPKAGSSSTTAAITESELEALLKQVISSNKPATSGNIRPNAPPIRALSPLLLDELVAEILSWVPVKSLLRFKCVCKLWKSLISDPKFVKLHLRRSMNRNEDFNYLHLLFECEPDGSFDEMYASYCSVSKFIKNPSSVIDEPPYRYGLSFHRVVGSCHGLICLMGTVFDFSNHKDRFWVRLWNPVTRKSSQQSSCFYYRGLHSFGFGYDDISDTYKAVAVLFDSSAKENSQRHEVKVHTIGGNCWRNIQCFPAALTTRLQEAVYLNGTLNWIALGNMSSVDRVRWNHASITIDQVIIVSLHLGKERYTQLALPQGLRQVPHNEPTIGVLRDCLCVFLDHKKTHFEIWQMMEFGVEESWTRLLNVSYQYLYSGYSEYYHFPFPVCMSLNGDILMLSYFEGVYQAILYNPEGSRIIERSEMPATMYIDGPKFYVESLVWPY